MSAKRRLLPALAALALALPQPGAAGYEDDYLELDFYNRSDVTATVTIDGRQVCYVAPGASCLWNNNKHPDGVREGARYAVRIENDHGLWEGTASVAVAGTCRSFVGFVITYTFDNDGVQTHCTNPSGSLNLPD